MSDTPIHNLENDIRLSTFQHPVDAMEPDDRGECLRRLMGDVFARSLVWMVEHRGKRRSCVVTTGQRALIFVWCVRPDLIQHKTAKGFAKSIGMDERRLREIAAEFRELVKEL